MSVGKPPPVEFVSFLGGVFWQGWEAQFDGDPVAALTAAGYPIAKDCAGAKAIQEFLLWVEDSLQLRAGVPALDTFSTLKRRG